MIEQKLDDEGIVQKSFEEPIMQDVFPCEYRMARLPSGEVVLQGRFAWSNIERSIGGSQWKTLPIVSLGHEGKELTIGKDDFIGGNCA
jgi:hypothetical protein